MSDPPSRHQQALPQSRSQNTSTGEDSRQGLDQRLAQTEEEIYPLAAVVPSSDDAIVDRDITQRKQLEEQLLFHANIAQSISDAVIATDMQYCILSWNDAAERLYGWKREEVLGKYSPDILATSSPHTSSSDWLAHIFTEGFWKGEVSQKRKDGTSLSIFASVSAVKDFSGSILGFVTVNRDITERKALEKRKDDFISMASHELKTPVTSIAAFAELLQLLCEQEGDAKYLPYLSQMNTQVARLTRLINDVLDLSKIQAGKLALQKTFVDLNALVKETVETLQLTTKKHQLLVVGAVNTQVWADQDRIGQVLTNLIANAIRYTPEPGNILVNLSEEENAVTLSVQDFGIGIPCEHQAKIFERYYRVGGKMENTFPGLGMGLYISHEIIQNHGGCMWVDSATGKGSTFSFSLPLKEKGSGNPGERGNQFYERPEQIDPRR